MEDKATSPPKARPFRNFLKLVPVLEWFYPIDHRRLWKDAYNEAYPNGKTLKESYKAVWEVNTLAAVLVLAMNASLFFNLITGESKDFYWEAEAYTSLAWWTMVMGGVIVVINFVHLNCLLVVHGVYSAVDDDNFRAIVSARGPTGRLAMIPDYLVVCSMYGMAMWWCMLLLVHVKNIVGSAVIIGLLLVIVTFLVSYSSYAARIIYHSGAHKPESIFQEIAADSLPRTHEELGQAIMERALNDMRQTMEPLNIGSQIQKDLENTEGWTPKESEQG
ncbi:MAG: hypothetical protein DWC01_06740 [Candidatus Poseidoniales archaeon]|nr:MAG: hypothetical protein DWC01_06740 [Candidatus Poseidoniales archaeon]